MNSGKRLEQQWRKSAKKIDGLFYYRFRDGTATYYGGGQDGIRFQQRNICDAMMFYSPLLFLLEMKSTRGSSLPFGNIRYEQLKELCTSSRHRNVLAGFIVYFEAKGLCFFASANSVKDYIDTALRKSLPLDWFRDNSCPIAIKPLRVNVEYEIGDFLTRCLCGKN